MWRQKISYSVWQMELQMQQKIIQVLCCVLKHANTVSLPMRERLCQNHLKTISSLHLHKHSLLTYFCH